MFAEDILHEIVSVIPQVSETASKYIIAKKGVLTPAPQQSSLLPAAILGIPTIYLLLGGIGIFMFKLLKSDGAPRKRRRKRKRLTSGAAKTMEDKEFVRPSAL